MITKLKSIAMSSTKKKSFLINEEGFDAKDILVSK